MRFNDVIPFGSLVRCMCSFGIRACCHSYQDIDIRDRISKFIWISFETIFIFVWNFFLSSFAFMRINFYKIFWLKSMQGRRERERNKNLISLESILPPYLQSHAHTTQRTATRFHFIDIIQCKQGLTLTPSLLSNCWFVLKVNERKYWNSLFPGNGKFVIVCWIWIWIRM